MADDDDDADDGRDLAWVKRQFHSQQNISKVFLWLCRLDNE